MNQNQRVLMLVGMFILLLIIGVTVIVLANRPFVDYRIVSPTALPQFDPFIATQAAQQTQTSDALLIDLTAAMDTRVQNMHTASLSAQSLPSTTAQAQSLDCGWMWATQPDPELSSQIQQQLTEALVNVDSVEARAESFGENCLNQDGSVRRFATMQTDFRIRVEMGTLETADPKAIPDIVSPVVLDILRVLSHYPVGSTPGPQPGQIIIQFPAGDETYEIFISDYNTAMGLLNQGLTGSVLLDALGGLRS